MSNPWFRLYHEFADDPKVQILSEPMQRRLIMLFCHRCKCDGLVTFREQEAAFHWRITPEEMSKTKDLFIQQGFIDKEWNLLNWNDRQYLSDSSTDRTRAYRERMRTSRERHSDGGERSVTVGVTVQDTEPDTETDTEQRKTKTLARSVPPEELAGTLPLVDGSMYSISKGQVSEWASAFPGIEVKTELRQWKVWLDANPTRRKTAKGIARATVAWLSRAQDKSGNGNGGYANAKNLGDNNFEVARRVIERIGKNSRSAGGNGHMSESDDGRENTKHLFLPAGEGTL